MDLVSIKSSRDKESEDVVWISVSPGSCSQEQARIAASNVKARLATIPSLSAFECHIKESAYVKSEGATTRSTPLTDLAIPFMRGTIGIPIQVGYRMGSLGIFVRRLGDSSICYITARHAVLADTDLDSRPDVALWADPTPYQTNVEETLAIARKLAKRPGSKGVEYSHVVKELEKCLELSTDTKLTHMGTVTEAPSILLQTHTRDVAIVEVPGASARAKIESQHLWIGSCDALELSMIMGKAFEDDRLTVTGLVGWREIRGAKVIKRGSTTNITTGTINGALSKRRVYQHAAGMVDEICVLGDGGKAFSAAGDSGAVAVDAAGRAVGLLTGGMGLTDATDVTYLTPMDWLLEQFSGRYAVL